MQFTAVQGGGTVASQNFAVLNTGQGTATWGLQVSNLTGNGILSTDKQWLTVSPSTGSSTAGSLQVPIVEALVNVTGLQAGQYFASIRIDSPGSDALRSVNVGLTVLPPGANPGVLVRPTGLVFAQQAGSASAITPQSVRLASSSSSNLDVVASPSTLNGGNWLTATARNLTLPPGSPQTLNVQPTLGLLAPGQYFGTVTLLFGDRTSDTVNVLLLVTAPAAASCVPARLLLSDRLGSSFGVPVNSGSVISVEVKDDCGNAVTIATVVATFSNGNPALNLTSSGAGVYTGTWRPTGSAGQVTVTLTATWAPLASAAIQRQGQILAAGTVFPVAIVNAASFAYVPGASPPLAPGSIVSVFGSNLALSTAGAASIPLPTKLGGFTMTIDGQPAGLFYASSGQVNMQFPTGLAPNSKAQAVAKVTTAAGQEITSLPLEIQIGLVQPGIFTVYQSGTGQGVIMDARYRLVDSANPAKAGDVVQIFATGLGATIPPVLTGQPAPAQPPFALVATPVDVRIGGLAAKVEYAGLCPGFVGLYQVNAQIPAGVPAGLTPVSSVSLVIVQGGVSSNTVTIAVR